MFSALRFSCCRLCCCSFVFGIALVIHVLVYVACCSSWKCFMQLDFWFAFAVLHGTVSCTLVIGLLSVLGCYIVLGCSFISGSALVFMFGIGLLSAFWCSCSLDLFCCAFPFPAAFDVAASVCVCLEFVARLSCLPCGSFPFYPPFGCFSWCLLVFYVLLWLCFLVVYFC